MPATPNNPEKGRAKNDRELQLMAALLRSIGKKMREPSGPRADNDNEPLD